jgi:hypothetical protein
VAGTEGEPMGKVWPRLAYNYTLDMEAVKLLKYYNIFI